MDRQQENLLANPFYIFLRKNRKLYEEVESNSYCLCIPQRRAVVNLTFTITDLGKYYEDSFFKNKKNHNFGFLPKENHIILPSLSTSGELFTKNKKTITIQNNCIKKKEGLKKLENLFNKIKINLKNSGGSKIKGFVDTEDVKILYEELNYGKNDLSFRILYLENLLEGGRKLVKKIIF